MNPKGVCPVCKETVGLVRLVFTPESGVTKPSKDETYLTSIHPPKDGCKTTKVVSIPSGKVVETFCDGSMRPVKDLIQVH